MAESSNSYIVLVEPETDLAKTIQRSLEDSGYQVNAIPNGQQALRQVSRSQPALMIIDSELPDMSGYEVCRTTQSMNYHIPIILLSTMMDNQSTPGESGRPDAYVKKPVEADQLLNVVSQQLRGLDEPLNADSDKTLNLGTVQVDLANNTVHSASGTKILTKQETELLQYLSQNANKPVKRKKLLEDVWQYQNTTSTRTVDVHIAKLRSKIEKTPSDPEFIITIHGIGYMLKSDA